MIFLRYESFKEYLRLYPITVAILTMNILIFLVSLLPALGQRFLYYGAFITVPADPFVTSEIWRYVTAVFLHADFSHLLFNMFAVLVFTPPLELLFGKWRYLLFFLLCGIGGNFLVAAMNVVNQVSTYTIAVGASGAIYGVYGAYLFIALYRKQMLDINSRKTVYIILGLGIVMSIFRVEISFWGHVGGALTGFLLYSAFERRIIRTIKQ